MKKGKLILVGAGPGDVDLITVKGVKAIEKAEVLLYDALVNTELLEYAPTHCLKIFVGKRLGNCAYTQEQINALIQKFGLAGKTVVRLKGGDSFVFGRGMEEIETAELCGMTTQVIPGISSSIGVPAINKIPVSSRGVTQSFTVVTATNKYHKLSEDIHQAVKYRGTVVILMGIHKATEIEALYRSENKGSLPFSIIQNGSCANEKIVYGNMDNFKEVITENNISNPAVIVVGEVTRLYTQLQERLKAQDALSVNLLHLTGRNCL